MEKANLVLLKHNYMLQEKMLYRRGIPVQGPKLFALLPAAATNIAVAYAFSKANFNVDDSA